MCSINYRLSRARRVVENAFGILTQRFRVFLRPIAVRFDVSDKIVKASCYRMLRMFIFFCFSNHYLRVHSLPLFFYVYLYIYFPD